MGEVGRSALLRMGQLVELAATCHAQLPLSIPCLLLGCEQRMEGAVMGTSDGGLVTAAAGKCTDESVSSA